MNEQDFLRMIDERVEAIFKFPRMWGTPREIELVIYTLMGFKSEIKGEAGDTWNQKRAQFCEQNGLRSKFNFADQCVSEDEQHFDQPKHIEILRKFVEFCNT